MSALVTRILVTGLLLASVAAGFLISNSPSGGGFRFEALPSNRRPVDILVDTEAVPGVGDPRGIAQDLMNQWNLIPEAEDVFGEALTGGPYNGTTVGETFGRFTNTQFELAFDDTGEILMHFGINPGVLGISLKSVTTNNGNLLDFLIVVNTAPGALSRPGSTAEELFRATLLHELGHGCGLGHTPTGFVNTTTFGLSLAPVSKIPTMFAFRLPQDPEEGGTLEADDAAGLIEIYPADTSGLGSISGRVHGLSGAGANEIAVRAVGPQGGAVGHIGVLTNADGADRGNFTIPNLPPGGYMVVVEPVNGRGSIGADALAGGTSSLGGNPFFFATDEYWQPGDSHDPAVDSPSVAALVQVRAGRDTGSLAVVLNAIPHTGGAPIGRQLTAGDTQLGDATGGFHFVDYYTFAGTTGDVVTITARGTSPLTPQLALLRPSDLALDAEAAPNSGRTATLNVALDEDGPWTLAVSARATTGNPGGTGSYTLTVGGATGTLPSAPPVTAAALGRGPADPGAQQFGSPVNSLGLLQVRFVAPSHEDLWVDSFTVRGSGTGDDRLDVTRVRLVHDRNGDGLAAGDPTLATAAYTANDGTIAFDDLDVAFRAGTQNDILVVYDIAVQSVMSQAGHSGWWFLLALVPLCLVRRRRLAIAFLLAFAFLPMACGGGGAGSTPFNPDGAVVDFQVTVGAGDITVTTPTRAPGDPLRLPASPIASGTLMVSN